MKIKILQGKLVFFEEGKLFCTFFWSARFACKVFLPFFGTFAIEYVLVTTLYSSD